MHAVQRSTVHRPVSSIALTEGADAQTAGHSDDERGHFRGSDVGRSDSGEVEMMEFERQGLPRRSSASTLDEQAGTRAGNEACLHTPCRRITWCFWAAWYIASFLLN